MQLRAWPFVVALALAGVVTFVYVERRAPGAGALSAASTAQRPDATDAPGDAATLAGVPPDLLQGHARTAPATAHGAPRAPAPEREVLQRFHVSVTDDRGAPVPGARLDVETMGAKALGAEAIGAEAIDAEALGIEVDSAEAVSAWLDVTAAHDARPQPDALGLAAGDGAALVVSVLRPEARVLMLRASADGWRPETRHVPVTAKDGRRDDVVLVLRRGASVTGRLIDGDGKALRRGQLALALNDESIQTQAVVADSTGRFEAAVRFTGEVTAHATSPGVGSSASRPLFLPEGRRTELGDFVVLGPGRISGRASLRDGTLLAKGIVSASLQGPAPGLGLRSDHTTCDEAGRFALTGLAVGAFSLSVMAEANAAPDASGRLVATGTEEYELIVDAVLVTVRAVDDAGVMVPMASIESSTIGSPDAPIDDQSIGASSTMVQFGNPIESHEWLVSNTRSFLMRARGVDGVGYYGSIEAGHPSGRVAVDLVARPAALASIVLRAESHALPADASLEVDSLITGSRSVHVLSRAEPEAREPGAPLVLEIAGLKPGSYELSLSLARGGTVALVDGKAQVVLGPGEVRELAFETYVGGSIELQVDSPRATEGRAFVQLEARLAGAPTWDPLVVDFSERDAEGNVVGSVRGSKVLLGGPAGQSQPLRPGDYELRLTAARHRPQTTRFRLDPGATTSLRLQLTPVD